MSVIVIGGGPAGMIAAIEAAKNGYSTLLLEKNQKLGKKLYITGKGRCNLTNACDEEAFLKNIPGNPYFLYSAIYTFNSDSTMQYFEQLGVPLKVERGNRVFPVSDKSSDIIKALETGLKNAGAKIRLNTNVTSIILEDNKVKGVTTQCGNTFLCHKLIIATGGLSYPQTGSTGDGYQFAKASGHKVTSLHPSLVSIETQEKWVKDLAGLNLKNIGIVLKKGNKVIYKNFGEMLFSHKGISGPVVLSASRKIIGLNEKVDIYIDLKPAIDEKSLNMRILKDFEKYINKDFKNALDDLLPQKIIPIVIMLSKINPEKKVHDITKEERKHIVQLLKAFPLTVKNLGGYNEAVVTAGGIHVTEIDPGTMESKIVSGMYFAGEVIDIDGFTGGFNLQIAFSTGYIAGQLY